MSVLGACLRRGVRALGRGTRWWSSGGGGPAGHEESPLRRLLDGAATYGEGGAAEGELQWATQPYAARPPDPSAPAPRQRRDPRDAAVLLFPGQGSQFVGMGKRLMHLPAVRDLYDLASETLKWDVRRVCESGPAEELSARCQVCVLVTSLAALEAARDSRPGLMERVRALAGFSLGELTALVVAGAIDLEPALRLTEVRTAAMRAACAARGSRGGGMATVWLAPDARLQEALRGARAAATAAAGEGEGEDSIAHVANYLYPNCKVIAGDEAALAWLERSGGRYGVRRVSRVDVSGPFHSAAMLPAAAPLREALEACQVRSPRLPVYSNVDAKPYRNAKQIVSQLPRQLTSAVRWEQTLHALYARPRRGGGGGAGGVGGEQGRGHGGEQFPLTVALGPGRALRATLKQVNAKAWDRSLQVDA